MPYNTRLYKYSPTILHPLFKRIHDSDIASRLVRGVFWSMAGSGISRGLMLCATILAARILGKTVYGEFGMIQSTVGMIGIFAGFGLSITATKHVAEHRERDPGRAGRIIGLMGWFATLTGGGAAIGLILFAPWLAEHTLNAPHLASVLRIGSLILFINALNGAQTGALSGFEAFKAIAHVNLIVGVLSFPLIVCGAYFGGLIGTVSALAANLCLNLLLNHLALCKELKRNNISISIGGYRQELPLLWQFALPAMLSGFMVGPANWTCRALLANRPGGYSELGILTAALLFQNLLMAITNTFSLPLLTMVSNAREKNSEKLGTVNILSTWILGVLVAIPLLCFWEFAQNMFGDDYATGSFRTTFSLIVLCTCIVTFKAGLARILAANDLLWWGFLSNSMWAAMLIGCTVFLVPWGALGLATSLTIAYVVNTLAFLPLYYRRNLVPKNTMLSSDSAIVWSVLFGLVVLNVIDVNLTYRALIFVPCLIIVGRSFKRLAMTNAF